MPTNKNAQLRYQILDRCFSDFHHKYFIEDLMDKVNDALMDLYGTQISIRQIREDIKYMKDRVTYNAPIEAYPCEGRKCYYRYSDKSFSIYNNELSAEEVASLRSTIDILSRFRGVPTHAWLEDVISNLEFRFGVRPNPENVLSFEHNDLLKGTEFLGELIDSALNHQPLNLLYRTFAGNERTTTIHPYHIKQFNGRWFLLGLQEGSSGNYITNKALDRYNVNVDRARAIVAQYANKLRLLLDFLDRLDKKLADGKLDEAEADALITDAKAIGTALTA